MKANLISNINNLGMNQTPIKYTALIVVLSWLAIGKLFAQNSFPIPKNSYVKIDGGSIDLLSPVTESGWARGLSYFIHSQPTSRVLGLGMFGGGESAFRFYIAYGQDPWQSRLGLYILPNGNTGIGTFTPNEKLSVNGNIRAKEVKVEMANWPDYVFQKDYALLPLDGLRSYIKENGHLPGIPTAQEVETDGVALAEMNRKLLEKVEELTLYLIEINETNRQIKEKNELLENRVSQLENPK